jgi:hypothetical protein
MSEMTADEIRSALQRLSTVRPPVFGANHHRFVLNRPVVEHEMRSFEQRHRISLPADYRQFMSAFGNGGAGPFYGVFPLGIEFSETQPIAWQEQDGLVGILSEPFPHRQLWNDLVGIPPDELIDTDEVEYERLMTAFEERYWASTMVNGAIPICHIGCALRIWLVVTGEERGRLWRDGRADFTGLSPVLLSNGTPAEFSSWYREWLDECLAAIK